MQVTFEKVLLYLFFGNDRHSTLNLGKKQGVLYKCYSFFQFQNLYSRSRWTSGDEWGVALPSRLGFIPILVPMIRLRERPGYDWRNLIYTIINMITML